MPSPPSEPCNPVVVVITPGGDATTITGGTVQADRTFQVVPTSSLVDPQDPSHAALVTAPGAVLGENSVDVGIDLDPGLERATVSFELAALTVGAPFADTPSSRWVAVSTDPGTGVTTPLTYTHARAAVPASMTWTPMAPRSFCTSPWPMARPVIRGRRRMARSCSR